METIAPPEIWKGELMVDISIRKAFHNVSLNLSFKSDKIKCVIFGPSGSGKSSLLKMIAGFYNPDQGYIKINNTEFFNSEKKICLHINRRNIGYLPQEYPLFPHMSVMENIAYGPKIKKMDITIDNIHKLARKLGIEEKLSEYPKNLSGGQKQRAALARSLILNPTLLLLDEPFSALDKPVRENLRELVSDIAVQMNITTVFVTHDVEEAFVFGEDAVLIADGSIIEYGDKVNIFNEPKNVKSAQFLDFKNIWKIKYCSENRVVLENGDELVCKNPEASNYDYCCIKPENVMILRDDMPFSDKENRLYGYVESMHNRGGYVSVVFKSFDGLSVEIHIPNHAVYKMALKNGSKINISLKKESLILCN